MKLSSKTKKIIFGFLLIIIISSLGIFGFGVKSSDALWGLPSLSSFIDGLMSWVLRFILSIFGVFLSFFAKIFDWALNITSFTKAPAVLVGWRIVRDLANMVLVLILLAIALSTILRLQTYGVKALLPKLIIAALLINFSLVGAGIIIDFTQIVTNFFVGQSSRGDFGQSIVKGLSLQQTLQMTEGWTETLEATANIPGNFLVSLLGGIFIILTATVIFALGAFLLIVRVMALWILLILVPGALLCWILPATRNLWNKWVQTFFRWAFFAPVYAFFLYLALVTIQGGAITSQIASSSTSLSRGGLTGPNFFNSFFKTDTILMYIMVFALLVGGLIAARQMGIYGAQGVMGVAKFIGKGAAGTTSRRLAQYKIPGAETFGKGMSRLGAKLADKRFVGGIGTRLKTSGEVLTETKGRGVLSPGAWKRSWPEWRKETERRAYAIPTAQLQDQIADIFSLGKDRSDYTERTKRQQRIEERKKIVTVNAEELVGGFQRSLGTKDQSKTAAYAQALAEQGDLNDLLRVSGYEFNAEGISQFTEKELKPLLGEQDAYRLGFDLTKALEKVGQWPGRIFKGEYDPRTGKTTYTNLIEKSIKDTGTTDKGVKESLEGSYKAWSRMDPQEKSRFTHRLGFISENEKGENTGIKGHEMFIMGLSAAPANVIRMQDEVKATLMLRHADETKTLNRELYDRLSEIFEKMSTDQIDQMRDMLQKTEAGVVRSTWVPGGGTTIY